MGSVTAMLLSQRRSSWKLPVSVLAPVQADASGEEVVFQDGIAQEVVTLLGPVAAETLLVGHLVGGLVHGLDDGGAEGLGDVADAQRDDVGFGMDGLEGIHLLGDVGEQVVVRQFQEVFVYESHSVEGVERRLWRG